MTVTTLAERALAARERAKFATPGDAAEAIGCSRTLVISWEDGTAKSIGGRYLLRAAAAYKVNPKWLSLDSNDDGYPWTPGSVVIEAADREDDDEWRDVLGYGQAAGLGGAAELEEYAITHKLKFRASSLKRKRLYPKNLHVYYGKGDSMEPTIMDGDAVMFDTSDTKVRNRDLYLVRLGSEVFAKRALVLDDRVYFESDNNMGDHSWNSPKRMDDPKRPIEVIGRIRWVARWVN